MVSQREVETRANRIRNLTTVALEMLKQGKGEAEIKATLKEMALRNWGLSSGAVYNYVETALSKAKAQHAFEA